MPDDRYFEPDVETMPPAAIATLQEERLLELVPYVYERAGLYREVWDAAGVHPRDIRSADDFERRVPFIDKDAIRSYRDRHGDPFGGLLCVDTSDLTAVMSSSGTTGDATFFPEIWTDHAPLPTGFVRDLWGLGLRPGDVVIATAATFRGPMTAYGLLGAVPVYVNSWMGNWLEVLEAVQQHQAAYFQLLGPNVVELDHLSHNLDLRDVFASVKATSFAGEPLGSRMQAKIRDDWGLDLFLWTSAGDTGTAWECTEHDGYHLWEDTVRVEHLDPLGDAAVAEGDVGELVVTAIDNLVAPLVRYRTDDLIRLSREPCGCGRTHARQWPVGRKGDETVVRGHKVLPLAVWAAVEQLDETETGLFQIIRPSREVDELRIRVGYDPDRTGDLGDLDARLRAAVSAAVGVEPALELVPEAEILARSSSAAKVPRVATS